LLSRNWHGYLVLVTERRARDEGAEQTQLIMKAVRRARLAKGWSAQQLAGEMTAVGVPWNADIVVNLEHGRRKSLRVHELLALAWVLDAASPVDLLVPEDARYYPVTPKRREYRQTVLAWFAGKTGPLRQRQSFTPETVAEMAQEIAAGLPGLEITPEMAEAMLRAALARKDGGDGQD
jgi:transcriptional regulator with XRE-family HTH domain